MGDLPLSLDCGPYDRTQALRTGEVKPAGIDLTYVVPDEERQVFARMIQNQAFDLAEMAAMYYLVRSTQSHGGDPFPFVGLPVFPSRAFRHGYVFVNTGAGIKSPQDLEGRSVGCTEFRNTASVWIRGLLQNEYDVDLDSITWFEGGVNRPVPPSMRLDLQMYRPTESTHIPAGATLSDMLAAGELDAVVSPRVPDSLRTPAVARLLPDFAERERSYYQETAVFPIMHIVVMRRNLYDRHPWVADSMYQAFVEAKARAMDLLRRSGAPVTMLPWQLESVERMDSLLGPNPWVYGLEQNRPTLETLLTYLVQQGFLEESVDPATLFAPIVEQQG